MHLRIKAARYFEHRQTCFDRLKRVLTCFRINTVKRPEPLALLSSNPASFAPLREASPGDKLLRLNHLLASAHAYLRMIRKARDDAVRQGAAATSH